MKKRVCVKCRATIDKGVKVCPFCNNKQPSRLPEIISIVLALITLAVFAVYVKGLLDDMGMKMVKMDGAAYSGCYIPFLTKIYHI